MKVQNPVNLKLRIVFSDANLARHIQRNFFQAVLVSHAVNEGHQKVQPGGEGLLEFTEPFNDPRILLGHHFDGSGDEYQGDDQDDNCNFHGVFLCFL